MNRKKFYNIVYRETVKALRNPMPRGATCGTSTSAKIPEKWLMGRTLILEKHHGLNPREALREAIRDWNEQARLEKEFKAGR